MEAPTPLYPPAPIEGGTTTEWDRLRADERRRLEAGGWRFTDAGWERIDEGEAKVWTLEEIVEALTAIWNEATPRMNESLPHWLRDDDAE